MTDLSNLTQDQRALLYELLRDEGGDPDFMLPLGQRPVAQEAPLSFAQQRMWFAYRQAPLDGSYNIQVALRIKGPLDVSVLTHALTLLIQRHETLRTSVQDSGAGVVQRIHPAGPPELIQIELNDDDELASFVHTEALRPWRLDQPLSLRTTLIHAGTDSRVLLLGMHHILCDAWSLTNLTRDLWQLYSETLSSGHATLPPLPIQYADYAHWEQQVQDASLSAQAKFWQDKLTDAVDLIRLPLDRPRHQSETESASIYHWSLPSKTAAAIQSFVKQARCSTFSVCLSGFYLLLHELTGQRDILVASPVANRSRAELEPLIGYFANTVVMRGQWSASDDFESLVRQVNDYGLEVLANQSFPFERIIEDFNPRRLPAIAPLTQVFFAFQQQALGALSLQNLHVSEFEHASRSTRFDLETHVWENGNGGIEAAIIYPDLFQPQTIERWAARLAQVLELACGNPSAPLRTFVSPPMTQARQQLALNVQDRLAQLLASERLIDSVSIRMQSEDKPITYLAPEALYDLQITQARAPKTEQAAPAPDQQGKPLALIEGAPESRSRDRFVHTLVDLLAHVADHHPETGCVFIAQNTKLTYPSLQQTAHRIGHTLLEFGLKPGDILLFQLESEQAIIEHFWGAITVGVIPLIQLAVESDQTPMHEQLISVWRALQEPTVLVTAKTELTWRQEGARLINTSEHQAPTPEPLVAKPTIGADDIAFISLSSGTSGRPKAIPLTHRNLLSRAIAARDATGIDDTRVMLNWQSLNHIGSMSDWHLRGVTAGATLVYGPTSEVLAQPLLWLDWLDEYRVTDTWAPNFAFTRLIEAIRHAQGAHKQWDLSRIELCLSAGESIVAPVMDQFEDQLAPYGFRQGVLQPAFGMAETSSGITYHRPTPNTRVPRFRATGQAREFACLGRPISAVAIRVVDELNRVRHEGEVGRVQIKGEPVFNGYYQAPEMNETIFTEDGWLNSGDLGFIHQSNLYITGREKAEIVVNGRNISCESVEIAIGLLDEVRSGEVAVCGVHPSHSRQEQCAVFFCPAQWPVEHDTIKKIRGMVAHGFGFAPDYLLPINAESIPRTAVGKIRRHVLSNQFNEGLFDELASQIAAQEAIIADSFFQRSWARSPLEARCPQTQPIYILTTNTPLAASLAARLVARGGQAILIDQIKQIEATTYDLIDLRLLEHTHPATSSGRATFAFETIRSTLQQLALQRPQHCLLTVVTTLAQVTGREQSAMVDDIVVSGLLKSAHFEFSSWLECRHIDLDEQPLEHQVDVLEDELSAAHVDNEVAYRQQHRLRPQWSRVRLNRSEITEEIVFDPNRLVVISGGLGGIAKVLATRLRQTFDLPILLLGRSIPNSADQQFIDSDPGWSYRQVNVSDKLALEQTVAEHEAKWGKPLGAVIHLAGTGSWQARCQDPESHLISHLAASATETQFDAKITGTRHLFDLVSQRQGAKFIGASSVLAAFGGSGFSVYAAANCFLTEFCRAQRQLGHQAVYCIDWPSWINTGMSIGMQSAQSASAGYISLTPDAGWHILLASLLNRQNDLLVGLAPNHPSQKPKQSLTVYYTSHDPQAAARCTSAIATLPWLQSNAQVDFEYVQQIPSDSSATGHDEANSGGAADATQYHLALINILQDLLDRAHVEPDDNFFELGAHSLLMVSFESRIKQDICDQVELLDLFRYPSVRRLSRHISRLTGQAPAANQTLGSAEQRASHAQTQARLRQTRLAHRRAQRPPS